MLFRSVSQSRYEEHQSFAEKCGFPFEMISDPDEKLCRAFDVIQKKNMYGREVVGVERSTFVVNAKGVVCQAWRKVKVDGHAAEVLAFLQQLDG